MVCLQFGQEWTTSLHPSTQKGIKQQPSQSLQEKEETLNNQQRTVRSFTMWQLLQGVFIIENGSFLVQKIIAVLTEDNMYKDSDQTITWLCFSKESIVISSIIVYIAVKKTSTCRLQYICHFKYLINLYVESGCQELDRLQHRWYDWLDVTCIYYRILLFLRRRSSQWHHLYKYIMTL